MWGGLGGERHHRWIKTKNEEGSTVLKTQRPECLKPNSNLFVRHEIQTIFNLQIPAVDWYISTLANTLICTRLSKGVIDVCVFVSGCVKSTKCAAVCGHIAHTRLRHACLCMGVANDLCYIIATTSHLSLDDQTQLHKHAKLCMMWWILKM